MKFGWLGYVLAALVLIAGVTGAVSFGIGRLSGMQDAFTRVLVPGSIELTLDRPGTYTIFHEPSSVVDGRLYSAPSISGLAVTVASLDDGQPIALVPPAGSETYSMGGHSGKAVLVFTVAKPGRYRLTGAYPDGRTEPQTVLAVSRNFVGNLLGTIFGAIGIGFSGVGLTVAIALTTFFLNRRASRRAQPARSP